MNKLIIIGNGFDLAHGHATRYTDFILWLVKDELKKLYELKTYDAFIENPLFTCVSNRQVNITSDIEVYLDKNILDIIERGVIEYVPQMIFSGSFENRVVNYDKFTINTIDDFGRLLLKSTCENWVDIEHTYYKSLKNILNINLKNPNSDCKELVSILNAQLSYLCGRLKEYLSLIGEKVVVSEFKEQLNRSIDYKELFKPRDWEEISEIDFDELHLNCKTLILNFNYTDTVEQYFNGNDSVHVNYIHGSITDPENPMIFGYGDELDDDFLIMEKQEIKGFLEHAKSLWYLRTRNYHNLIRFIESDYYQVQIIGHSCGRSDRTLLNTVFEHDNCNSVDIYYRKRSDGTDSFNEISEEVSRQFKDKQKLRKRVLPKSSLNIIPQAAVEEELC
ncbi:AbiH family protein [Sphingobacterium faecium]|uniref:AbiH family protein n=1 Tax=Sphingobacterium faecium TaxID=34087 RepID=UPI002469987B|nr:AbiH family protein [Sphingobacterium faecium]MDH5826264.1 AbiH family protein [Sphingobacterium faecium]